MTFSVLSVFPTTAIAATTTKDLLHKNPNLMDPIDASLSSSKILPSSSPSRLTKRQIEQSYKLQMKSLKHPWVNPCDGIYEDSIPTKRQKRQSVLLELHSNIVKELSSLKGADGPLRIDDINQYVDNYRFLPRLNPKAQFSIQRMHSHMKVNVAAMTLELRAQLKWDHLNQASSQPVYEELRKLLQIERSILCDLEVAFNKTSTQKKRQRFKNNTITGKKLRSKLKGLENHMQNIKVPAIEHIIGGKRQEPNAIEQRFVKFHTLRYICGAVRRLKKDIGKRNIDQLPLICTKLLAIKPRKAKMQKTV